MQSLISWPFSIIFSRNETENTDIFAVFHYFDSHSLYQSWAGLVVYRDSSFLLSYFLYDRISFRESLGIFL